MKDRRTRRARPTLTTLEGRALMTGVTRLSLGAELPVLLNNSGAAAGAMMSKGTSAIPTAYIQAAGSSPKKIPLPKGEVVSFPAAINDAGQVIVLAGKSRNAGPSEAFLYSPKGGAVRIPALPGYTTVGAGVLSPGGLVAGIDGVAGSVSDPTSSPQSHAFVYGKSIGLIDLGEMPGYSNLLPTAIDDASGTVAGTASPTYDPSGNSAPMPSHAFVFKIATRTLTDLGTLPGLDDYGDEQVNAQGQVAGQARLVDSPEVITRVFVATASGGMKDVGTLPGYDSVTLSTQFDDGSVLVEVANSQTFLSHAALYRPGVGLTDLGPLPSPSPGVVGPFQPVSLGRANKLGQAIVTDNGAGASAYYLFDSKTNQSADITTSISDAQNFGPFMYAPALTDSGRFVISATGTGTKADGAFVVSVHAKGKPYHVPALTKAQQAAHMRLLF